MKRAAILLLFLTGCSTAPVADMLDFFKPGKIQPEKTPPYGGVCLPRPAGSPVPGPLIVPQPSFPAAPIAPAPVMPPPTLGAPPATELGAPPGAMPAIPPPTNTPTLRLPPPVDTVPPQGRKETI